MTGSASLPSDLPAALASAVEGAEAQLVGDGREARTWRLTWADGRSAHLKVAGGRAGASLLVDEAARLRWLAGRVPVPAVLAEAADGELGALLLSTIAGVPAHQPAAAPDVEHLVVGIAAALRRFHELPVEGCPFDRRIGLRLADARRRVAAGDVTVADLDEPYQRRGPEGVLALAEAQQPADGDLVVTHGDAALPNLLLDPADGGPAGFVDLGRCGVGDRYADLADTARSLARNVSPEVLGPFFDAYGIATPDLVRLDYHVLLTQLA